MGCRNFHSVATPETGPQHRQKTSFGWKCHTWLRWEDSTSRQMKLTRDPKSQKKLKIQVFQPFCHLKHIWYLPVFFGHLWCFLSCGLCNWSPSQFYGDVLVVAAFRKGVHVSQRTCAIRRSVLLGETWVGCFRWKRLKVRNAFCLWSHLKHEIIWQCIFYRISSWDSHMYR